MKRSIPFALLTLAACQPNVGQFTQAEIQQADNAAVLMVIEHYKSLGQDVAISCEAIERSNAVLMSCSAVSMKDNFYSDEMLWTVQKSGNKLKLEPSNIAAEVVSK